jgi:hypothetical protein
MRPIYEYTSLDGTNTTGNGSTFAFSATILDILGKTDVITFTEGGLWSGDQSAHFSALNTNLHTYWGF